MTTARLWSGELSDEVYGKIINIMECVHNLDGNYCESEALQVAKVLQDFTLNDIEEIDQLNIDIHDDDEYDTDDNTGETYVSPPQLDQADELISLLTDSIERQ